MSNVLQDLDVVESPDAKHGPSTRDNAEDEERIRSEGVERDQGMLGVCLLDPHKDEEQRQSDEESGYHLGRVPAGDGCLVPGEIERKQSRNTSRPAQKVQLRNQVPAGGGGATIRGSPSPRRRRRVRRHNQVRGHHQHDEERVPEVQGQAADDGPEGEPGEAEQQQALVAEDVAQAAREEEEERPGGQAEAGGEPAAEAGVGHVQVAPDGAEEEEEGRSGGGFCTVVPPLTAHARLTKNEMLG